jgi:Putative death-receptor fusion protein (DUF2428)
MLLSIGAKGSKITRRSAGIPAVATGLLVANSAGPLFSRAMNDLTAEARKEREVGIAYGGPLPQVHALNCLRAIFVHSALGSASEEYIPAALELAGKSLTSTTWPIRNCGLMLFRALIDRLLGSTESQNESAQGDTKHARFSYTDIPQLLDIIVRLLEPTDARLGQSSQALESVFPGLKLLQRIYSPKEARREIRERIMLLLGNPHWHVRDMAARTLAPLQDGISLQDVTTDLLPSLNLCQNLIHGRLLSVNYLLKRQLREEEMGLKGTCSEPSTK